MPPPLISYPPAGVIPGQASPGPALRYQRFRDLVKDGPADAELLFVSIRYKEPDGERSRVFGEAVGPAPDEPSDSFVFAAAVAEFGLLLRESRFKAEVVRLEMGGRCAKCQKKRASTGTRG